MPVSVKPRPSWNRLEVLGGDDDEEREAAAPLGRRVVIRPIAVSVRLPLNVSWTMPAYWPLSGSKNR